MKDVCLKCKYYNENLKQGQYYKCYKTPECPCNEKNNKEKIKKPFKDNLSNKPHNLLFEVFTLGMEALMKSMLMKKNDKESLVNESIEVMDKLAKQFGYSSYEEFDKFFDNSKSIVKE